ncbi:MAG TPA: cysteine desulfurase family protein [Candidatus Doudnabacteria bacterium]|nr:cysteine desulfurase family protein [Candidatus Doudnabacteria bacterium]
MKSRVYLDNAASTQLDKRVFDAMRPFLTDNFGNPSSLHASGQTAKQAVENARLQVANILHCKTSEIIFTSGGTESINLAILGWAKAYSMRTKSLGRIIISAVEHEAVLETAKSLEPYGWKIDYLPVDKFGAVNLKELNALVKPNTALVSVMYANNEVGTIQPIAELGAIIAGINRKRVANKLPTIAFHTDACQAGSVLNLNVAKLKVDMLTLNGSKLNGPKGAGILFVKTGTQLEPLIYGGGQEQSLRSGTENTPAIIGFGLALKLAQDNKAKVVKKILELQAMLEKKLNAINGLAINGPRNNKFSSLENNFGLKKLPGTINFSVGGVEGEALMLYLDAAGFAVATGSACTTGSEEPSHVLIAMGVNPKLAKSTIRLSLGYNTTKVQLSKFITVLSKTVDMLKNTKQNL